MISFYDDQVTFDANSSTNAIVTFEPFTPDEKIFTPVTIDDITFTPIEPTDHKLGPNLVVVTPDSAVDFQIPLQSNVLTESGNENFEITFSTAPTAIGFDTYTNSSDPPVVTVYDTAGQLRAQYVLIQLPNTLGFLGIVSDRAIGKVHWLATQGGDSGNDTGIANVRVGDAK
jgi:hypothetical protein